MSYRNKIILIGLVCFICGVRVGHVGADDVMIDAVVTSFEKLTGQGRVLGLF